MCSLVALPSTVVPTKFSAVDAARLALEPARRSRPWRATPSLERRLRTATVLWCRELQFPSVRALGHEVGLSSPSSVVAGFDRLIDLQGEVIHREWQQIEACSAAVGDDRRHRLVDHAVALVEVDRACLRLPGLVCWAVGSAWPPLVADRVDLAVALLTVAAFADEASAPFDAEALDRLLLAVGRADLGHDRLAVPA